METSSSPSVTAQAILRFWFEETAPEQWWRADAAFDRLIGERYGTVHARAIRCELHAWRDSAKGRLAEILVLDQFSRNIHRGTARAFVSDPLALALAQEAVAAGADRELDAAQRAFLYMPYMHSESSAIHVIAETLFRTRTSANSYDFELRHKAIIDRFGRYPHRNTILGRESTADEQAFLLQPGSAF
jgi:uncharacterized protein (DUF924 family)